MDGQNSAQQVGSENKKENEIKEVNVTNTNTENTNNESKETENKQQEKEQQNNNNTNDKKTTTTTTTEQTEKKEENKMEEEKKVENTTATTEQTENKGETEKKEENTTKMEEEKKEETAPTTTTEQTEKKEENKMEEEKKEDKPIEQPKKEETPVPQASPVPRLSESEIEAMAKEIPTIMSISKYNNIGFNKEEAMELLKTQTINGDWIKKEENRRLRDYILNEAFKTNCVEMSRLMFPFAISPEQPENKLSDDEKRILTALVKLTLDPVDPKELDTELKQNKNPKPVKSKRSSRSSSRHDDRRKHD